MSFSLSNKFFFISSAVVWLLSKSFIFKNYVIPDSLMEELFLLFLSLNLLSEEINFFSIFILSSFGNLNFLIKKIYLLFLEFLLS